MIPKNPITLLINGWLTDQALKALVSSYLPNYEILVTSAYRTAEKQADMKKRGLRPAADSAHLYNLARDFVLKNKSTGKIVSDEIMQKVFSEYIEPNWEGYAYFSKKTPATNTGWIHINLDRGLSDNVKWIGYAATAAGLAIGAKTLFKDMKSKLKK